MFSQLSGGVSQLSAGVSQLLAAVSQLSAAVSQLPATISQLSNMSQFREASPMPQIKVFQPHAFYPPLTGGINAITSPLANTVSS
ncbi:hypothetical protein [Virgibacillus profundi]|uniref:hypothetical protein n=1 Tax=Virgibacillus profundi TaxID=2024555 RepID=UPI0034DE0745